MGKFIAKLFGGTALLKLVGNDTLQVMYQNRWDLLLVHHAGLFSASTTDSTNPIPSNALTIDNLNSKTNYLNPMGFWLWCLWQNLNSTNSSKSFTSLSLEHCHKSVFTYEKLYTYFLPKLAECSFIVPRKMDHITGTDMVCALDHPDVHHGQIVFRYKKHVLSMLRKYQSKKVTEN